jgi:hypothetical protein
MKISRTIPAITTLAVLLIIVSCSFAQQPDRSKTDESKVSLQGTFSYVQRTGNYMVTTEKPPVEYFIVNPEPAVLDKLVKEGKQVQIEGRLTIGADQLLVEKINGKQYSKIKK